MSFASVAVAVSVQVKVPVAAPLLGGTSQSLSIPDVIAEERADPVRVPTLTADVSADRTVEVFSGVHCNEDGRGEQSSSLGPTTVHTSQPVSQRSVCSCETWGGKADGIPAKFVETVCGGVVTESEG